MYTPWGSVQHQHKIADGIVEVSTASHGGIALREDRWAELKEFFPEFKSFAGNGWLEEDCDWAAAVALWPELFTHHSAALRLLKCYHADEIPEAFWTSKRGQKFLAKANE